MKSWIIFRTQFATVLSGLIFFALGTGCLLAFSSEGNWLMLLASPVLSGFGLWALYRGIFSTQEIGERYVQISGQTRGGQDHTQFLHIPDPLEKKPLLFYMVSVGGAAAAAVAYISWDQTGVVGLTAGRWILLGCVALFLIYDYGKFEIRDLKLRRTGWLPFFRRQIDLREVRGYYFHSIPDRRHISAISFYDANGRRMMKLPNHLYETDFLEAWLSQFHTKQAHRNSTFVLDKASSDD